MTHCRRLSACLAAVVIVMAVADEARACSCMSSGPPCQQFFQVDAVFVGTVQRISDEAGTSETPFRSRLVAFTIDRAIRGVDGPAVDITTGFGGGDCGYAFKRGERYLVYAWRNGSHLGTGICSRTRPVSAAAEDLKFIADLPASAAGAHVYGSVTRPDRDVPSIEPHRSVPVSFVHVQLRGPVVRDAQTDDDGRFDITNLPVGRYELQLVPPAIFSAKYLQRSVELRDARACAALDFLVVYDGRISGTVLTDDGHSAAGAKLEAMAVDRVGTNRYNGDLLRAQADAGGSFEFTEVPPGRYVVGVELQRRMESDPMFPKTFYPGTDDPGHAAVIVVGEGDRQALEPMRLPPARASRELAGRVVWSDGQPVRQAYVALAAGDSPAIQVGSAIKTDDDGRFKFVVHDGLTYVARAWYNLPDDAWHRQLKAVVGPFVAGAESTLLQLVLVRPVDP